MLVIGHRGAAGLAPENSIEALRAGLEAGADILEFDIRLTKDNIPVLSHDFHTVRTHQKASIISHMTLKELKEKITTSPIVSLSEVLDELFGKVLLNIELKGKGTGEVAAKLIEDHYIDKPSDWDSVLFSSFKGAELVSVRRRCGHANLAYLHNQNPFIFIAYQRKLHLAAVGFHRLYINAFALEIAKRLGLFIYVYTVDRPHAALLLHQRGIGGVVTNRPDKILGEINKR